MCFSAEITDEMSLEAGCRGAESVSKRHFTPWRGKIKRFCRLFPHFFGLFVRTRRNKNAFAFPLRWGRRSRLGNLAHARLITLPRDAHTQRVSRQCTAPLAPPQAVMKQCAAPLAHTQRVPKQCAARLAHTTPQFELIPQTSN